MRSKNEYSRTQHNFDFDPGPHAIPIRASANTQEFSKVTSRQSERLLEIIRNAVKTRRRLRDDISPVEALYSINSLEYALDYLLDNFVLVNKSDIQGISSYFCDECLSFEIRYIQDTGNQEPAASKHMHIRRREGTVYDEKDGREQAYQGLVSATNSLFSGRKFLLAEPRPNLSTDASFRGPRIEMESITPQHWARHIQYLY